MIFLRVLKYFAFAVGGLLAVGIAGALFIWWRPETILNEAMAKKALRWAPAGTQISWSGFRWDFTKGFWEKTSDLELKDLCVKIPDQVEGCLPQFRLSLSFSVRGFRPQITAVRDLTLDVAYLNLYSHPEKASSESPLPDLRIPAFGEIFPAWVSFRKEDHFHIEVKKFQLISPGEAPLEISLSLQNGAIDDQQIPLDLRGQLRQGKTLSVDLAGIWSLKPQEHLLEGKANASVLTGGWKFKFPFEASWSEKLSFKAEVVAQRGKDRYAIPLQIAMEPNQVSLSWRNLGFNQLLSQKKVLLDRCRVVGVLDKSLGYPKKTNLDCQLDISSLQSKKDPHLFGAALTAELNLKLLRSKMVDADFTLHEHGTDEKIQSKIEIQSHARLDPLKSEFVGEPELKGQIAVKIPELRDGRRLLRNTDYSIPAPLRALKGGLELHIDLASLGKNQVEAKVALSSDLHGAGQNFVSNSTARALFSNLWKGKKALDIEANVELTDIALEAPPLSLSNPPSALPDNRFSLHRNREAKTQDSSFPVTWRAQIHTKNPVRIRSNLLQSPMPIALDLRFANDADMEGTVGVQTMPLELFNKKAELQYLNVNFQQGTSVAELKGDLIHRNPEVLIHILILGSTDKPRIEFESDPPLTRQQIVSVLLFNKSVSELTEDEAASSGNFSQATADGALGLFSLLFLSRTPVESISYDPVTQTYAARLRLDQKTTVSVGSDFEQERQVAIRRRLGGPWALSTELRNNENGRNGLLTLLEWFKRY